MADHFDITWGDLEAALDRHDMVVLDMADWYGVRLSPTGERSERTITIGDDSWTFEVALHRGEVTESGDLPDIAGPRRRATPTSTTPGGTQPKPPAPRTEAIVCRRCHGTGLSGARHGCRCLRRARPRREGGHEKHVVELNANDPADRQEAASRAEPDCTLCAGTGFAVLHCYPCGGIGWFHHTALLEITTPGGVVASTVSAGDLAPFAREGRRRGGTGGGVLDLAAWLTSQVRPFLGDADLVVVDEYRASSLHTAMPARRYRAGQLEEAFAEIFGVAAAPTEHGSWPPDEPVEAGPRVFRRRVAALPPPGDVLAHLLTLAGGRIGFWTTGIATGESGPACGLVEAGRLAPGVELGVGYRALDAAVGALHRLSRGEWP